MTVMSRTCMAQTIKPKGFNQPQKHTKMFEKYNKEEVKELQKIQCENKALRDALQYLVDTKERKDTIGKDSIYLQLKLLLQSHIFLFKINKFQKIPYLAGQILLFHKNPKKKIN